MQLAMKVSWFFVLVIFFTTVYFSSSDAAKPKKNETKKHVCQVEEEEKQMTTFDFRIISNENTTHEIETNEPNGTIYFNLCSPLKEMCSSTKSTSVCLKRKDEKIVLGTFPPKVTFESSQILFKFTGEKCNDTANYTTTVIMQCDYKATQNNSSPIVFPYDHNRTQCDIYIHWQTSSACGEQKESDCFARDKDNYTYDLSNLTDFTNNYKVAVDNSSMIILNVCHSVIFGHGVSCNWKSGSCLVNLNKPSESGLDLGDVNPLNPPFIENGLLKIEYKDGGICTEGVNSKDLHWKTIINFVCNDASEDSLPKFIKKENCIYYLEWRTPFVCKNGSKSQPLPEKSQNLLDNSVSSGKKEVSLIRSVPSEQVNCSLTTERGKIDLTPLILTKGDYLVKSNDSEFHINVCNPLISEAQLSACQGKTVCKFHLDKNGTIVSKSNLGNPDGNLSLRNDKNDRNETVRNVVLQYKTETSCPENDKNYISTNITFSCAFGVNTGSPQFDKYEHCTYLFKWQTKYVCDSVVGDFYENCTISNPLSRTINLSVLKDQTFFVNTEKKNYTINVCGKKNLCNGSTVCDGNNGYGSKVNVIYEYPTDSVRLNFTKGTACLNGTYESSITFVCNSNIDIGRPTLILKPPVSQCYSEFEWQSKLVCTSESDNSSSTKPPIPSHDTKGPEKEAEVATSHGTLIVLSLTGLVILVVSIIYLRNPSRRIRCYRTVTSPCSSSNNDRVKYCRINTTEEARLLLDNNCEPTTVCQSDTSSDDDLLGA